MTFSKSLFIIVSLALFFPGMGFADDVNDLQQQMQMSQEQLEFSKQQSATLNQTVNQFPKDKANYLQRFAVQSISDADIQSCQLMTVNSESSLDNINIAIANARASLQASNQIWLLIKEQKMLTAERVKQRLILNNIIDSQNKRLMILEKNKGLADQYHQQWASWCQQLQSIYDNQVQQPVTNDMVVISLQHRQQLLNQQLANFPINSNDPAMQFQFFVLQEQWASTQVSLFLEQLKTRFQPAMMLDPEMMSVFELNGQIGQTENMLAQIKQTLNLVESKINFINLHKNLFSGIVVPNQPSLQDLIANYKKDYNHLLEFQTNVKAYHTQLAQIHHKQFTIRQRLPGISLSAWHDLFVQMWAIPQFTMHWLHGMVMQILYGIKILTALDWYYLLIIALVLIPVWIFLRRGLMHWLRYLEKKTERFSSQVLSLFLHLIRRNLGLLLISASIIVLLILLNLELTLWLWLIGTLISYRFIITLAKLWLLESENDISKNELRLYRQLHWIFALTSIGIIFVVLTHVFPVTYEVRIFFNKILMLLLLALSIFILKAWSVLPQLLQRVFGFSRPYIARVMTLLCMLIPIAILSNALIGLIGYAELAWTIAKYQVFALLILTLYLIIRGLLIDLMDLIYGGLVRHLKTGWLWGEALIRPLDRLLRIALFIFMLLIFVHISSLDQSSIFLSAWKKTITLPLFTGAGATVTIPWLFWAIVFIAFLYWVGKWSREFCFRWIYKNARDIGLRNSLSVFTQYGIVIIGTFLGLKIFGIDLAGLTVIAAAFVAGIGFGLRDIISNFFSGILLLVERPFRTGDTVSIGTHEGEVVSTGMRSLKMRTWDHMEVIVPNADMFTKPFVNWTHQDKIIRSVIHIKVHPADDPHQIKELILEILYKMTSVVDYPKPEVLMIEMNEAMIEIEIQLFVNLQHVSREKVRSEVLFAIRDSFKAHGIRSPFPRYDIHVLPND